MRFTFMSEFKHVKPLDGPIDEGIGGVGSRRIRDAVDDERGTKAAMPKQARNDLPSPDDGK